MEKRRHHLITAGILLFLLALVTGMIMPWLANMRMGLSAHLVGLLGGLFLIALGLIWGDKDLPRPLDTAAFWLALYGSYSNLFTTFLPPPFWTKPLYPLAGSGHLGAALPGNNVNSRPLSAP